MKGRLKTSRFLKCGVGGPECGCCFPARGSKERRLRWRSAKKKERDEAFKMSLIGEGT